MSESESTQREKAWRPTPRRAAGKSDSDVKATEYPIITKAAYDGIVRGSGNGVNIKMKKLCAARNRIGQTMIALDSAIRDWNPQVEKQPAEVYQRLRAIREKLEKEYLRFPLTMQK